MGYNYAYERARFEAEWKKKEEWYRSEGMSEEAILECVNSIGTNLKGTVFICCIIRKCLLMEFSN